MAKVKASEHLDIFYNSILENCLNDKIYSFNIANQEIAISFANTKLHSYLSPAINHRKSLQNDKLADYTIHVLDKNTFIPQIPAALSDLESRYEHSIKPIFYISAENYKLAYQKTEKLVELQFLNLKSKQAICWFDDISNHTSESLSAPFRTIFSWIISQQNQTIIHASAVGNEDGGVIFIGPGGSGKTTSSLSCFDVGMKFAGDDSVVISKDCKVFSLYSSARLFPEDLVHFENLKDTASKHSVDEKVNLFLAKNFNDFLISDFSLKAIIAPMVSSGSTELKKIKSSEALRILAPSSILHIPGQSQLRLDLLAQFVQSLPCYRLVIGERASIGDKIKSLLKELK